MWVWSVLRRMSLHWLRQFSRAQEDIIILFGVSSAPVAKTQHCIFGGVLVLQEDYKTTKQFARPGLLRPFHFNSWHFLTVQHTESYWVNHVSVETSTTFLLNMSCDLRQKLMTLMQSSDPALLIYVQANLEQLVYTVCLYFMRCVLTCH